MRIFSKIELGSPAPHFGVAVSEPVCLLLLVVEFIPGYELDLAGPIRKDPRKKMSLFTVLL
jgi:hypothetical protein